MIKIENTETVGWEAAIRGMRNPMNSWSKSDSYQGCFDEGMFDIFQENGDIPEGAVYKQDFIQSGCSYVIGENDLGLMKRLAKAGTDHRKFMRMIAVYADVTAPLYWWKEADTYKVGTVANSCSTMHNIHTKEFTEDDFSCEHLMCSIFDPDSYERAVTCPVSPTPYEMLQATIHCLNECRELYLQTKDKRFWWQMIQLLPSSYNQKRTLMLNYEVLANIYHSRKNHKLDEWHDFCAWIESLPYSELITGESSCDD
jgi:hypothetical protein